MSRKSQSAGHAQTTRRVKSNVLISFLVCLVLFGVFCVVYLSTEVETFQPQPTYSPTEQPIRFVTRTSPAPPYTIVPHKQPGRGNNKHKSPGNQMENEAIDKGNGKSIYISFPECVATCEFTVSLSSSLSN